MSQPAIRVDAVSKRYQIGSSDLNNLTFREAIVNAASAPIRRYMHLKKDSSEAATIWALKDVSFEVQPGEVLGVIGGNGAGKSTLLKILSHITAPTEGRVEIRGRVASLLEVGTGFHPELTGRENIILNGAILGMGRREIDRKFEEIVEFSEVGKFIDTPVKRYSSGMYLRLAFSVAAHLEPEILIVDEVLAVGDASFQKKCLGKMQSVATHGRTVVFVSHNMGAVNQLCPNSVWLDKGRLVSKGKTGEIVSEYLRAGDVSGGDAAVAFEPDLTKEAQIMSVRLLNDLGDPCVRFSCDDTITVEYRLVVRERVSGMYGYCRIARKDGTPLLISLSEDCPPNPLDGAAPGEYVMRLTIPPRILGHGDYLVYLSLASQTARKFEVDPMRLVCSFQLDDYTSKRGNSRAGYLSTLVPWHLSELHEGEINRASST